MAIELAKENVKKLVTYAKDITVEGAIISDDGKMYEVTLSYDLDDKRIPDDFTKTSNLWTLAQIMITHTRKRFSVVLASVMPPAWY